MTPSADLFQLIHALTPSEKRYFKLFAQRHVIGTKNQYEKLFDAFDALPRDMEYDEAAFKRSLKGRAWAKNFAVQKSLLQELVLSAMHAYHVEKTEEGKLNKLIVQIQFLYDKGLFEPAKKLLAEAFESADGGENLTALIILYQFKNRLTPLGNSAHEAERISKEHEVEKGILKTLDLERRLIYMRRRCFSAYLEHRLGREAEGLDEEMRNYELEARNTSTTVNGRFALLTVKALLLEHKRNYKDALLLYEKTLRLVEDTDKIGQIPATAKMQLYANYLACAHYSERFDLFEPVLKQLQAIVVYTFRSEAEKFRMISTYKLLYALNCDLSGAEKLCIGIKNDLQLYQHLFPLMRNVVLRFNLCLCFFKLFCWNELIDELNENYKLVGRQKGFDHFLRDMKLLEVMAQISLSNYDVAEYQLRNLSRWLQSRKLNNPFAIRIMANLKLAGGPSFNGEQMIIHEVCPPEWMQIHELYKFWISR